MDDLTSDEDLMKSYAAGNVAAFHALFARFKGKIYGFLFRRLGSSNKALTEDLFQLTWLKVHQNRDEFDSEKKFSTWIFTIAQNSMLDHLKKASTRYETGEEVEFSVHADVEEAGAEKKLLRLESEKHLEWAIAQLPENMKDAIVLCELEELPSKEAAKILGRSDNAVRQSLFKGRKLLRELLTEDRRKE